VAVSWFRLSVAASHYRGLGTIPGQPVWDLRCKTGNETGFALNTSVFPYRNDSSNASYACFIHLLSTAPFISN